MAMERTLIIAHLSLYNDIMTYSDAFTCMFTVLQTWCIDITDATIVTTKSIATTAETAEMVTMMSAARVI